MQNKQTKFDTDNNEHEFAKSEALKMGFGPSEFHFLKEVKRKETAFTLYHLSPS